MMEAGGAGGRDERLPQWSAEETRELIAARGEIEREAVAARRSAKTMWDAVAARLRERGYRRTAEQCKCKWKNLVNRYKVLPSFLLLLLSNELCCGCLHASKLAVCSGLSAQVQRLSCVIVLIMVK
jgi:hypothetical protein